MARPPKGLHVGDDLTLPLDAITQSIALLAVRRAGSRQWSDRGRA